jgi:SAM-dependent methyltransferase
LEQEAIWDYFQNHARDRFDGSVARLRFLAKAIDPRLRVLNIGVGAGTLERLALAREIDIFSLDPSRATIESLQERFGMAENAKVGYSQQIPFADSFFDGVVMSEVLEHVSDDVLDSTLNEVRRVVRVGGRFWGTVPAREVLNDQATVCPCCGSRFHRWGHVQTFDRERIRRLLMGGFEIERLAERSFVSWSTLNWKGKVSGFAKMVLERAGIHGSGETVFFCAKRR